MNFNIDPGRTYLPICECGWRGLPELSYMDALKAVRRHETDTHPGDQDAYQRLWQATRRATREMQRITE